MSFMMEVDGGRLSVMFPGSAFVDDFMVQIQMDFCNAQPVFNLKFFEGYGFIYELYMYRNTFTVWGLPTEPGFVAVLDFLEVDL
jgi:hypothetical protein